MTVMNLRGTEIDFDAAVVLMDEEIIEELHADGYETEQAFFTAYEFAYQKKYGEEWELSKKSPQW